MQTATVNNANTVNATANNTAWDALVAGVQGVFAQPVDIATANVKRYDMGREVGTFTAEPEERATVTVERKAKTVRVAVTAADAKPKKADIVRAMIATAKAANRNANDVVADVVAQLGFAKALATAYVRNNWDRV